MSVKINKIQDEIIAEFSNLDEWFEKYKYLINLGKTFDTLDEKYKSEENLINGCQSQVWFKAEKIDNKILFYADSDSMIVKGMISLLLRVLNNQNPREILNADLYFIEKIGLKSNLSPSRANGLFSILKKIKSCAMDFSEG